MKLPIYLLDINEDEDAETEVNFIALVDRPAIKLNWQKFTEFVIEPNAGESQDEFIPRCIAYEINNGIDQDQAVAICYSKWDNKGGFNSNKFAADAEKQIVSGPLMIADMPIYRKDKEFGEYYAVFNAATIEKIAIKYYQKGFQSNVNLMHDGEMIVEGATMFESWIVDRAKGKMPMKGYEEVADGSWFGSFKVNNPAVWSMVKDGLIQGFSVEGLFQYKPQKQTMTEEQIIEKIQELLLQLPI